MKLLIDQNLSPLVATEFSEAGHDAVHVRDLGMESAEDSTVLDRARSEGRVLCLPTPISGRCLPLAAPTGRQSS